MVILVYKRVDGFSVASAFCDLPDGFYWWMLMVSAAFFLINPKPSSPKCPNRCRIVFGL